MQNQLVTLFFLAIWIALWVCGGWLIICGAFHTARNGRVPLALIAGLTVDTIFANILGQFLPLPLAFWLAAVLVLLLGVVLAWGQKLSDLVRVPLLPGQLLLLAGLTFFFTLAERGAAMFDDYAHIPTLSLIATGDIPPHFALNAEVTYAYHYFVMLFASQFTRIAGLKIWTALDIARALTFAVTIVLAVVWTRHITRSAIAGMLGGFYAALGMGTRWLLLLLPPPLISMISPYITHIGSARASGNTFDVAIWNYWKVDGLDPVAIPLAFANGIYAPGVLNISGPNSTAGIAILLFFLLTFNRWRGWRGAVVTALMIASEWLLSEAGIVLSIAGWGGITLLHLIQQRVRNGTFRLSPSLMQWLAVIAVGNLIGAAQGGAFTDIVATWLREIQGQAVQSYQTVGFTFSLTPVIVSSHLGVLSLLNPAQLLVALFEMGPVILVLPLLGFWGVKAYRAGRWYEAVVILSAFLSLGTLFITFTGSTGVRNTSRLYSFILLCGLYAVPLVWLWVKQRSELWKWVAGALMVMSMFGGLIVLSVKMVAIQHPVYPGFITEMDAVMYERYWNDLESDARIFDPAPGRAVAIFGRPTLGGETWFKMSDEWRDWLSVPRPVKLRDLGFTYIYLDNYYYNSLPPALHRDLNSSCVKQIDRMEDNMGNFRILYDIKDCR